MSGNGNTPDIQERGFDFDGQFYPWHLTDSGKDLMLIDRITGGMLPHEFFDAANDPHEQFRGPILLSLVATSIRNRHPEWSIERIVRLTENINLGDLEFLGPDGEAEEDGETPPPSVDDEALPESSEKSSASPATKSKKASATQG